MILAHRGLTHSAADNSRDSIAAVARAAARGLPIGIEVDIRQAVDALVMHHDPIEGNVVLASAELHMLLKLLGEDRFLTLQQALGLMVDIPVVNLEIKHGGIASGVLKALQAHCGETGQSTDCFLFSSFTPEVIADLRRRTNDFHTGLLIDKSLPDQDTLRQVDVLDRTCASSDVAMTDWILQALDSSGADNLHPHWSVVNTRLLAGVRDRGKKLVVWDLADAEALRQFADHPDVLHVITDYPASVLGSACVSA